LRQFEGEMTLKRLFDHVFVRNLAGLLALFVVHFVSDRYSLTQRTGFDKTSPYLFLVLMYGWIVFHNRFLFGTLFLKGRKAPYFIWTILAMLLCSANMYFIIHYKYHVNDVLPHILSFWVYTIAGLGVYIVYRNLNNDELAEQLKVIAQRQELSTDSFIAFADGQQIHIPLKELIYIESLENYVKVFTTKKSYVVRMSMKEAEAKLPAPLFIRISRSHIVSTHFARFKDETLTIQDKEFRIGRVYKKYVQENLK
jgi:hypothetical protein